MYINIKTSVIVKCRRSESLDIKVEYIRDQNKFLLLTVVIDDMTKNVKDVIKELPYANDILRHL